MIMMTIGMMTEIIPEAEMIAEMIVTGSDFVKDQGHHQHSCVAAGMSMIMQTIEMTAVTVEVTVVTDALSAENRKPRSCVKKTCMVYAALTMV